MTEVLVHPPTARSWRPLELAAAMLVGAALGLVGVIGAIAVTTIVGALAIAAAAEDLRTRRIPNRIVAAAALCVATTATSSALVTADYAILARTLGAGAVVGALYAVPWLLGKFGAGDVKLAAVLTAQAAFWSLQAGTIAFLLPSLLALSHALVPKAERQSLAFGPYLAAGYIVAAIAGVLFTFVR